MPTAKKKDDIKNHPNVKGKVPPHSEEAEKAILCCMLIDENVPMSVMQILTPEDFYYKSHAEIFGAMVEVWNNNKPIDLVTVTQELDRRGTLGSAGGASYVSELSGYLPGSANFMSHAEIVRKNSRLRQLMSASNSIIEKCYASEDALETLQYAEKSVYDVAEKQGVSALQNFSSAVNEAVNQFEEVQKDPLSMRGLRTGFSGIDYILGGLHGGDLVIIAARPGQGKTSIGMNIVTNIATSHTKAGSFSQNDAPVCAIFSLEMPAVQLAKRMVASVAEVDFSKLAKGEITGKKEWKRVSSARVLLNGCRIFIDDTSLTTPMDILSKCRRLKREQKRLDVVMVDYLTLMSSGKKTDNRQQDVSEISRMMKLAAKELDVPILLLSQLSRSNEKEKRKPQLSDLRESGAIEQDADIIMFIHREADKSDNMPVQDEANIIIAKHRNGPLGTVKLRWIGEFVSFKDAEYNQDSGAAAGKERTDGKRSEEGGDEILLQQSGDENPF